MTTTIHAQTTSKSGKAKLPPATDKNPGQKTPVVTPTAPPLNPKANQAIPKELVPADIHPLDPKLEAHLKKWESKSAAIKTLHGNQTRSEFNHTFKVEKKQSGKFFLETPDKGRIDMLAVKGIKEGAPSLKKDKSGENYKLESGQSERWICTGDEIMRIDEVSKTYEKDEIPESERGKNIVHTPLPFLLGMKMDEATSRFQLSMAGETDNLIQIKAIPLTEKDQQNYQIAWIRLDKKTYLPTWVKLKDQSGLEIEYTFEDVVVNDSDVKSKLKDWLGMDSDPYHPNLKKYKPFVAPNAVAPAVPQQKPEKPVEAPPGKTRISVKTSSSTIIINKRPQPSGTNTPAKGN